MAAEIPTDIPDELVAGDTWKWTVSFPDYPAGDGWALAYYLRGIGSLDITAAASMVAADGDDFAITVPAASTAALAAGTYEFLARASLSGEVYTVDSGKVVVTPNVATATPGTLQAHAEKLLPIVRAEILARITGDGSGHSEYTIGSRQLKKFTLDELRKLEKELALEVARVQFGRLKPYAIAFCRPS